MQMHACIYVCKKPKHGSSNARALGSFYITRAISLPHSTQLPLKNWLGENAKHDSIARAPGSFCIRRAISLSLSLSIHFSFRRDNAMQEVGNQVVSDNEKAIEVQLALF